MSIMTKADATLFPDVERIDPLKLWYVPDRRVRTKAAAAQVIHVTNWILTGQGLDEEPDELMLFKSLHASAFRAARRSAGRTIPMSERRLWARRWQIIREHIVEKNLGLVHLTIRRFRFQTLDEDDLLSEAMYGLGRAIDRFNPWKGFRFSTYACNVIARALLRRGKGESRYRRLFPVQHDASYEKPSESGDFRMELCLERLRRVLDRNLGELTDLEATVLSHRFPMDREPRRTFQEIGNLVGLSKERVRQIQNIALQKLRRVLAEDPVLH
ncbi:MAG TPA: sigma-70 family RNA polymerase sigma factor [Phycisphaerae bacterium]|nr:sigma-70 family RNA polymerase sigma factor [Phycisphaerae bacterium]HOJ72462.1 sigma-70 family RNA polymerase sigma factor [Phycisphaerae bacterium]HOM49876.1 sigma-70 family RNA polymerase sigma factor [Phycisphaerae bacterium]HON65486.1 sigma-70 family RNA polymerase sigma factor [Phycisphaerae bacterium]HOQ84710.1 sigma-70 family RNA polymerase sigma factor [Phycisphaerae bacterium]